MGLHRFKPPMSGRMGTLWTLASIREAALIEYGCMGHMLYGRVFLNRAGLWEGCKLYSTHIDETDIAMGDTTRLENAIASIIKSDHPKVVFLLPSSVPTVIGTDLPAICKELQPSYPDVPLIPFGFGGFDIQSHRAVQEALLLLCKTLPNAVSKSKQPTFNIIGSCADLFRYHADAQEIVRIMEGAFGMKPQCVLTSNTSVSEIQAMGASHINLVIRREGLAAAKHLQSTFATPFMEGRPYGIAGTTQWLHAIAKVLGITPNEQFMQQEMATAKEQLLPSARVFQHVIHSHPDEGALTLGGHADVVSGIRAYGHGELSLPLGACWCDSPAMGSDNIPYLSETEWSQLVTSLKKGLLMASGEALAYSGHSPALQIANPDNRWRLNPYEPPFVGFRGAIHLADLWLNAAMEQDGD